MQLFYCGKWPPRYLCFIQKALIERNKTKKTLTRLSKANKKKKARKQENKQRKQEKYVEKMEWYKAGNNHW